MELGGFAAPADIDESVYLSAGAGDGVPYKREADKKGDIPSPNSSFRNGSSCIRSNILVMHTSISSPDWSAVSERSRRRSFLGGISPVTSTSCSSSGDHAAALIPLSTLPTMSTLRSAFILSQPRGTRMRAYLQHTAIALVQTHSPDISTSKQYHERPVIRKVVQIHYLGAIRR